MILISCLVLLMCGSTLCLPSAFGVSTSLTKSSLLSWHAGMPFPTASGATLYPPTPPNSAYNPQNPNGGLKSYPTHWYAGSLFTGPKDTPTLMLTALSIPANLPKSNEFYYVLLSAWDNTGSYDQVGFSDDYGVWGMTFSTTTGSCSNPIYNFTADALKLNVSTEYSFSMAINSTLHIVEFTLLNIVSERLWSWQHDETGVSYFIASKYYCGETPNYQNYEEVWNTSAKNGVPNFNFNFDVNEYCTLTPNCSNTMYASWKPWYAADDGYKVPTNVKVTTPGSTGGVYIHN
jgi:hypothetical protein